MAFLAQQEAVTIACTCGSLKPVCRTYFCRHCFVIRCRNCVSNEVDSIYCAFCLDNVTCEVRLKKTACHLCLECPICQHSLSVRSHTVRETTPQPQQAGPSKHGTPSNRAYYLACFFCRWTSRDSNIPDQKTASGNWPERNNPHSARLNTLLDYFKSVGSLEKSNINIDQKYMKYLSKPSHLLEDQFGFLANVRKQKVELLKNKNLILTDRQSNITVESSVATDEIQPLSEEFITKKIDLLTIPSLEQRFNIPDLQPNNVAELMPYHKRLMVKQSQRCRECEHNVCKPEYNPSSIKFKIQLSGYFCIPEVRILSHAPLVSGQPCEIIFKISNQFKESTTVKLQQLPEENSEEDLCYYKTLKKEILLNDISLHKSTIVMEEARIQRVKTSASIELPECELILPPRDDAADCDDLADNQTYNDDPQVVIWRKCNKVGIRMLLTPSEHLSTGEMVKIGFLLNFTYTNTLSSTLENKQAPQVLPIDVKMFIDVGALSESAD